MEISMVAENQKFQIMHEDTNKAQINPRYYIYSLPYQPQFISEFFPQMVCRPSTQGLGL